MGQRERQVKGVSAGEMEVEKEQTQPWALARAAALVPARPTLLGAMSLK